MIKIEKRTFEHTRHVVTIHKCDLCGVDGALIEGEWRGETQYAVRETTIKMRVGVNYPDMGSGDEVTVDICTDCFQNKLIPWLKAQGATPRTEEWDW